MGDDFEKRLATKKPNVVTDRPFRFRYALADGSPLVDVKEILTQTRVLSKEGDKQNVEPNVPTLLSICVAYIVDQKLMPINERLSSTNIEGTAVDLYLGDSHVQTLIFDAYKRTDFLTLQTLQLLPDLGLEALEDFVGIERKALTKLLASNGPSLTKVDLSSYRGPVKGLPLFMSQHCPALKSLSLGNHLIKDSDIRDLTKLTKLESLSLRQAIINGHAISPLTALGSLRSLDVIDCKFMDNDSAPVHAVLGKLTGLTTLQLSDCRGDKKKESYGLPLGDILKDLTNLASLTVKSSHTTTSIDAQILPVSITNLDLSAGRRCVVNKREGFRDLEGLRTLKLESNDFLEPETISNFKGLEHLQFIRVNPGLFQGPFHLRWFRRRNPPDVSKLKIPANEFLTEAKSLQSFVVPKHRSVPIPQCATEDRLVLVAPPGQSDLARLKEALVLYQNSPTLLIEICRCMRTSTQLNGDLIETKRYRQPCAQGMEGTHDMIPPLLSILRKFPENYELVDHTLSVVMGLVYNGYNKIKFLQEQGIAILNRWLKSHKNLPALCDKAVRIFHIVLFEVPHFTRSSDKKSYPMYTSYELRSWSVPQLRELAERKKFDQPPVDTYQFIPFEEMEEKEKKEEIEEKAGGMKKENARRRVHDRIEAKKARVTTPGKRQRYRKVWAKVKEDGMGLSFIHHANYVAVFEVYEEDRTSFGGFPSENVKKEERPEVSPFIDAKAQADAQRNANVPLLINHQGTIATLVDLLMLYCDFENPATKELDSHPEMVLLQTLLKIFVKITEAETLAGAPWTSDLFLAVIYVLSKYKHSIYFRLCSRDALIILCNLSNTEVIAKSEGFQLLEKELRALNSRRTHNALKYIELLYPYSPSDVDAFLDAERVKDTKARTFLGGLQESTQIQCVVPIKLLAKACRSFLANHFAVFQGYYSVRVQHLYGAQRKKGRNTEHPTREEKIRRKRYQRKLRDIAKNKKAKAARNKN